MEIKQLQLQLKVVWLKDFLGLAIDNVILDQSYSLTPYYFWPKTEALEQFDCIRKKPTLKEFLLLTCLIQTLLPGHVPLGLGQRRLIIPKMLMRLLKDFWHKRDPLYLMF